MALEMLSITRRKRRCHRVDQASQQKTQNSLGRD